jgi:hypothetical protein
MQNKERVRAGMVALNTRRQTATGNYGAHDITRDELRQWFVDNGYVELDGGKFPKGEREAINNHNRMVRLGKPHPNALRLTL